MPINLQMAEKNAVASVSTFSRTRKAGIPSSKMLLVVNNITVFGADAAIQAIALSMLLYDLNMTVTNRMFCLILLKDLEHPMALCTPSLLSVEASAHTLACTAFHFPDIDATLFKEGSVIPQHQQ